ncbi:microsomal glutathione transferase GSTMIC2 [Culex quinquefasciatus]|uniref:Microsomal glutathione S-transferase 1 n=1 Tax=Culex quinquefasciatus TaxID=7176 RepID=B0X073_CULQU|nr:microsomal glutathione transferase GSTMIC2 [Culex quinquefasciatus]|eukprot:XP_001863045.1 microsomal glutathione transferase GSTMIC2 [Culex quinquefasciatus]
MTKIFDNLDPDLFRTYAFWSTVLVLKMFAVALQTSRMRFKKKAFINPEDIAQLNAKSKHKLEPKFNDPDVERVRRAHRNDLENVLPFFLVAFLYLLTGPHPLIAANLIRLAALARICHSVVYAFYPVPQPARFLSFAACLLVTGYMAAQCVLFYF